MKIRKWYFAINETGIESYSRLIKASVISCKKNTTLKPICIYYGRENNFTSWLRSEGVEVVNHSSSILEKIKSTQNTNQWNSTTATGAYLRIDIPIIENEDDFVIYTDCDTVFLGEPEIPKELPDYFSGAPEDRMENWEFINTGVMIINIKNMRETHKDFSRFAAENLTSFAKLGHGTYDQGALNAYYKGKWSRLPLELNWKPYWGISKKAKIIHFHGPKPQHIEQIISENHTEIPKIYKNIFNINSNSMSYYLGRFHSIEQEIVEQPPSKKYLGSIDKVEIKDQESFIYGWAIDENGNPEKKITVTMSGGELPIKNIETINRPDVSSAIKSASPDSGYKITIPQKIDLSTQTLEVVPGESKESLTYSKGFSISN